MRLLEAPAGETPRAILDEVLAPHGLAVELGAGGRLVVVRLPATGTIAGRVRERGGGSPLPGALVEVEGTDLTAGSGPEGGFEIAAVPTGPQTLRARLRGFVVEERTVRVAAVGVTRLDFELTPAPVAQDSIVVTPSSFSILRQEPSAGESLSRREVDRLPHLSDDLYRVIALLPGAAGGDFSAQLYVRGGEQSEILVLVDGLEIYEPFHLKDFSSVFSIVDSQAVGGVDFRTGGFTAEYGDRMSGVLDISTRTPDERRTSLGVSFVNARGLSQGRFAGDRGNWLVSGRRGYLDLVLDLVRKSGEEFQLDPTYYDVLGRAQVQLSDRTTVAVDALGAYDNLRFRGDDAEQGKADASYDNGYLWLTLSTRWRPRLDSRTLLSVGRVGRLRRVSVDDLGDRQSCELCSQRAVRVRDERSFDFVGIKQDWNLAVGHAHRLAWGLDLRHLRGAYDYDSYSAILDPLETGSLKPVITLRQLALEPSGERYSGYLADRVDLGASAVLELGLRWDRQTYGSHGSGTADASGDQVSPRLNLLYRLGQRSTLRAAWGRFYQSEGIHELQIADGVTDYAPAQLAEHRLLGLESHGADGYGLRLEVYEKKLSRPRIRFENLHDPLNLVPEGSVDRVAIAPSRALARGFEAQLERDAGRRWSWRLNYALASVEDRVDGRWVARGWDQRHALRGSVNWELGARWNLNLAATWHSGWPTTPVTAHLETRPDGTTGVVAELGARNSERLPAFARLDARIARQVATGSRGSLTLFFEVMNLFDRRNVRGFSGFDYTVEGDGSVRVGPVEETWLPRIPSFGLTWSF